MKNLIILLIFINSCSFNLLQKNKNISYYGLTLKDDLKTSFNLCMDAEKKDNQIYISQIKTERPYDGFKVYSQNSDGSLIPLETVEWISPLSTIYPAELNNFLLDSCKSSNEIPVFTTNLISKADKIVEITLIFAKISTNPDGNNIEAKVTGSMRAEASGQILKLKSRTTSIKSRLNTSQKDLILKLQSAIGTATLQTLEDLMDLSH